MCAICEGAEILTEGEMPCAEALTKYGKSLHKLMGDGAASLLILQAVGILKMPISTQARDTWSSMLLGIQHGRAEEIREQRGQHRRDKLFAIGLTLFGVLIGTAIGWLIAQLPTNPF